MPSRPVAPPEDIHPFEHESLPTQTPLQEKVLLLGLGNDLLSDDAVGLRVACAAREHLAKFQNVTVSESMEMGLSLLELITGFDCLLLIDAIQTGHAKPGFVHELNLDELKLLPFRSPHFLGVGEVLALGHKLGLKVPRRVCILAIEVADPFTVSLQMTPALERMMPDLVKTVVHEARTMMLQTGASSLQGDRIVCAAGLMLPFLTLLPVALRSLV